MSYIENLQDIRGHYDGDTVVNTIPPEAALEAGRFLFAAGCEMVSGCVQLAEPASIKSANTKGYAPRTVNDLLGQVEVRTTTGREVVSDPKTKHYFIAGPHVFRLEDGREQASIGVSVWKLPD